MTVVPFTGVGPRMYEDFFVKRDELKDASGRYKVPSNGVPTFAVRLDAMAKVEEAAIALVPEAQNA